MPPMSIFWLAAAVVLGITEGITVTLTSIWFALGAVAAMIVALFGGVLWQQILAFAIVSLISLLALRPLAKTKLGGSIKTATNADQLIGRAAVVTEAIDNVSGAGAVSVGGTIWTARSDSDAPIAAGSRVTILRIEGVKVFVQPLAEGN